MPKSKAEQARLAKNKRERERRAQARAGREAADAEQVGDEAVPETAENAQVDQLEERGRLKRYSKGPINVCLSCICCFCERAAVATSRVNSATPRCSQR